MRVPIPFAGGAVNGRFNRHRGWFHWLLFCSANSRGRPAEAFAFVFWKDLRTNLWGKPADPASYGRWALFSRDEYDDLKPAAQTVKGLLYQLRRNSTRLAGVFRVTVAVWNANVRHVMVPGFVKTKYMTAIRSGARSILISNALGAANNRTYGESVLAVEVPG